MPDDRPKLDPQEHPYVFSASQIETADLCFRKWAFDKIDKCPREETEATALGSAVHDHLERYLKFGTPIDTRNNSGKIAMSGLKHMPPPMMPGMTVEDWFIRKAGGITYWGKKDAEALGGAFGLTCPIVWDHKTCGQFTWSKSEEDLVSTVQSGMYGWDAIEATGHHYAQLRWNYMRTKGAKLSLPVVANITRMQAEDVMCGVENTAKSLIVLLNELKRGEAIEAPPNYSACEAFGGCAHKGKCKPTALNALDAIMTQKTNETLLESMKNRKKNRTAAAAGKTPTTPVEEQIEKDAKEETTDKVNSSDRKDTPPPPPPEAKKAGGQWFQPVWDEPDWTWKFPEAYEKALAAEEEEKKKAEKTAAANSKKNKASTAKKTTTSEAAAVADGDLLDQIIELIATRVAEKLKN